MNHHYSAIELNDSGISSLLHHKYEEATSFFRRALSVMKEDVLQQEQQNHSKSTPASAVAQEEMLYESIDIEFYEPSSTNDKFQNIAGFQDPMICKMAISVVSGASRSNTKSFTSAVIYNLAITAHLWGLQIGSTERLKMALRLYEVVYRTHQGLVAGPNSISMIVTTTLNNVTSIHIVVGNHELATRILKQLMAIMTFSCTSVAPTTNYWQSSWKRICWCNILTLLVGPPSTAGAA